MADRTNLVPNPSLEVGTTGWVAAGSCTIARSTAQAQVGTACLAITSTVAAGTATAQTDFIPVTAGLDYTVQMQVRANTTARNTNIRLGWYDSSQAFLSNTFATNVLNSNSAWTLRTLTATAPAGAAYVRVGAQVAVSANGQVHFVDAVLLEQAASAGTYFDGDTPDTATEFYSWTGTAHNSTSTYTLLVTKSGTASGGYNFGGSATGVIKKAGTATGGYALSGSATGNVPANRGSAAGAYNLAGSAAGKRVPRGTLSGGYDLAGTAVGARPARIPNGSGVGTYDLTGSATGRRAPAGTAVGLLSWAGSASGDAPANAGVALGGYDLTGTAVGRAVRRIFTPPSYRRMVSPSPLMRGPRVGYEVGVSVVRIDGALQLHEHPPRALLEAAGAEGTDWFRGGHEYEVSLPVAAELQAAGYTVTEIA